MPYIDRHGRPELLMHRDIARGGAAYRVRPQQAAEPQPMSVSAETATDSAEMPETSQQGMTED